MLRDPNWLADLERYPPRPFLREQSIWAVWFYRLGRRLYLHRDHGVFEKFCLKLYWPFYRLVETITGITLPPSADIGPGLRIWHFGNIIIHPDAILGSNCTLRQGVTIGNRYTDGPPPKIGNNVDFGAYAQVLGELTIGNNCKIGAMSVVLTDIPDGASAIGIPAKIHIPKNQDEPV
jgi:serine O-acetyltransferase